ncbi:MAG: hypothetical protein FJ098_07800 [Deltaproteobacteria bacterium]|nr:hypothetical protein [Deltaproteobacteria bacterium]
MSRTSASTPRALSWEDDLRGTGLDALTTAIRDRLLRHGGPPVNWADESPEDRLLVLAAGDEPFSRRLAVAVGRLLHEVSEPGWFRTRDAFDRRVYTWRLLRVVREVRLEAAAPALAGLVYTGTLMSQPSPYGEGDLHGDLLEALLALRKPPVDFASAWRSMLSHPRRAEVALRYFQEREDVATAVAALPLALASLDGRRSPAVTEEFLKALLGRAPASDIVEILCRRFARERPAFGLVVNDALARIFKDAGRVPENFEAGFSVLARFRDTLDRAMDDLIFPCSVDVEFLKDPLFTWKLSQVWKKHRTPPGFYRDHVEVLSSSLGEVVRQSGSDGATRSFTRLFSDSVVRLYALEPEDDPRSPSLELRWAVLRRACRDDQGIEQMKDSCTRLLTMDEPEYQVHGRETVQRLSEHLDMIVKT